jgi:hypothetical protein
VTLCVPALALALLQPALATPSNRVRPELALTFSAFREESTRLGAGATAAIPISTNFRWLLDASWHSQTAADLRSETLFAGMGVDRRLIGGQRANVSLHALVAWARASERIQVLDVDLVRPESGVTGLLGAKFDVAFGRRLALRLVQVDAVLTHRNGEQTFGIRGSAGLVIRLGGGHP